MGGGAGGKGKGKEDDKEHVRKYGLTDDSAFTLADENGEVLIDPSTGMAVVPPTIGG
jgi:NAD/NADP transhydrogenase beta subunit